MGVLEFVGLDILPQSLDDHWASLSVDPKETSQAGIQFELGRLVIEHQKDSAAHVDISWPLHLEAICLLSCSSSVPLYQVIVRAIEVFIKFNDQRFKEG